LISGNPQKTMHPKIMASAEELDQSSDQTLHQILTLCSRRAELSEVVTALKSLKIDYAQPALDRT
jgi:chorismate mutase